MNYQRHNWELRRRRMEVQIVRFQLWLEGIASDLVPDGRILILAGGTIIVAALLIGLGMYFQSASSMESDAVVMLQSVREPAEIATDRNPLLEGFAQGGFALLSIICLGAVLVGLDRVRQRLDIED